MLEDIGKYNALISLIGLIFSVAALFLTIIQGMHSRKQSREFRKQSKEFKEQTKIAKSNTDSLIEHTKNLDKIKDSLTTKYLNQFPLFIQDIVSLIDTANVSLKIMCDVPGYGMFSRQELFSKYEELIKNKSKFFDVKVEIITLSKAKRIDFLRNQFSEAITNWDSWKVQQHDLLKTFLVHHKYDGNVDQIDFDGFIYCVEKAHEKMIEDMPSSIDMMATDHVFSIFMWIIDDKHAIFSTPSLSGIATERGFYSSDKSLIEALVDIFDNEKDRAELLQINKCTR